MNTFSELSRAVTAAAIEVHRLLGPGLMESVYEACLIQELTLRGFLVVQQCEVPIFYKGVRLKKKFYLDLVVNGELIIELKSVAVNNPLHAAQLLTTYVYPTYERA